MGFFESESQILELLDIHDGLLRACASGNISFAEFLERYDTFPMRCPLDGHESDDAERKILAKHAKRIAIHLRVWIEVLTGLCSDAVASKAEYIAAGRFGSKEGLRRLRLIVAEEFPDYSAGRT